MEKLQVKDLMSPEVISVVADDDLASVYDLMMDNHIRHLPVVDEAGDVVGLVSHRDFISNTTAGSEAMPVAEVQQLLRSTKVKEVMVTGVETVDPNGDVEDAARTMMESKFGCLPVTENGHLVGILTETDFVRCVAEEQKQLKKVSRVKFA